MRQAPREVAEAAERAASHYAGPELSGREGGDRLDLAYAANVVFQAKDPGNTQRT